MTINSSIDEIKGVGPELVKKLGGLGVHSIGDLVNYYPRRYEDYSQISNIDRLHPGTVTIEAHISQATGRYVRRGMHITEAIATDDTGSVRLIWFNQPYRASAIKHAKSYYITGDYALRRSRFSILNPSIELASNLPLNTARIVPVYRETKGLKSSTVRKLMVQAIKAISDLQEHLPEWLIKDTGLMSYSRAIQEIHFPTSLKALNEAKRRLGFEEIFELSLAALLNKYEFSKGKALAIRFRRELAKEFVKSLPFKLTDAQRKVIWRVYQDMEKTQPMNRLIEGDVGSGKTVVAAMASLMAMEQDFQVALMAPTEILARQHADTLYQLMGSIGRGDRVSLLIGGLTPKQKLNAHERIKSGDIKLMVGTHALISQKVDMHKLGLVIIDEQHRFGVEQRKKLQAKAGHMPHVLHMSATPIPRSLALTLYGELDISVLDELPPGRQTITTKVVSPNSRKTLYADIDKRFKAGRQMFVVCPLIVDSQDGSGLSVEEVYNRLSEHEFKHRRVGLLHGKMKSAEKDREMKKFVNREYDILVTTTVIEVGVDVPNASIMLIEGAERFGLAQIHQLRGRVGRGAHQSYCYLMPSGSRIPSQRIRALETISDGFKLAELDLQMRGPGAIYGSMQHGVLDLRIAQLTDVKLIASARNAAQEFMNKKEQLSNYPYLNSRVSALRSVTNLN